MKHKFKKITTKILKHTLIHVYLEIKVKIYTGE